jgi:hypothetical protein
LFPQQTAGSHSQEDARRLAEDHSLVPAVGVLAHEQLVA